MHMALKESCDTQAKLITALGFGGKEYVNENKSTLKEYLKKR